MNAANEPVWHPLERMPHSRIPAAVLCWLRDPASLTRRLQHACAGDFSVRLLYQGWGRAMRNESRALGVRSHHLSLLRQVQLLCDDKPWVYARTVIPRSTLSGRERRLAFLGNRPLGALLFADPSMRRGPVEVACIRREHPVFTLATQGLAHPPVNIWGRRSVFTLHDKPLLVSEIFLPDIVECPVRD
jgi:chorismate--pyruvate lyase